MQVFILSPRGFCAGVKRAIDMVEGAIIKYGNNIYVRHQIVHNEYVVKYFQNKGVIFVKELNEVPNGSVVVFSAHGVSYEIEKEALDRNLTIIDATCPLVKKVHRVAQKYDENEYELILIGHKGHPEVEGTMGRVSQVMHLVQNESDIDNLVIKSDKLAYLTQTTLSIDETIGIISKLKQRFPFIESQDGSDICYATQNRQDAVNNIIHKIDTLIVFGSERSSNSNRLRDIGTTQGINSYLVNSVSQIDKDWFTNKKNIGITSGASSPEILIEEAKNFFIKNFNANISYTNGVEELIEFHVPKNLRVQKSNLY